MLLRAYSINNNSQVQIHRWTHPKCAMTKDVSSMFYA